MKKTALPRPAGGRLLSRVAVRPARAKPTLPKFFGDARGASFGVAAAGRRLPGCRRKPGCSPEGRPARGAWEQTRMSFAARLADSALETAKEAAIHGRPFQMLFAGSPENDAKNRSHGNRGAAPSRKTRAKKKGAETAGEKAQMKPSPRKIAARRQGPERIRPRGNRPRGNRPRGNRNGCRQGGPFL